MVLGGSPAQVMADLPVTLPQPRDGLSGAIAAVAREIRDALQGSRTP